MVGSKRFLELIFFVIRCTGNKLVFPIVPLKALREIKVETKSGWQMEASGEVDRVWQWREKMCFKIKSK